MTIGQALASVIAVIYSKKNLILKEKKKVCHKKVC